MSTTERAAAIARWAEGRADTATKPSTAEQYQIVVASERVGMTVVKLALEFGRSEVEIGRVLAEWADSRPAAKRLLNARALQLAERMIGDADPGVALEILERLSVVDASSKGVAAGLTIQIGGNASDIKIGLLGPARVPATEG